MKNALKRMSSLLVLAVTLGLVLYTAFKNGDLTSSVEALRGLKIESAIAGLALTFGSIFLYGWGAASALRHMGHDTGVMPMFGIAIISEFYSGITPGATGGQPVAIYQMNRRGLPVGDSTSALLMPHVCFHIMLVLLTTVLGAVNYRFISSQVDGSMWLLILGYALNLALTVGMILLCFTRRPIRAIMKLIVGLARKLRLKKLIEKEDSMLTGADRFYNGMHRLYNSKAEFIKQLLLAGARLVMLCSVQYCVFIGLGLKGASYGRMLTMGVMQYCAAAYTPLPGASGAQEGVFALFFGELMPGSLTVAGMLAWRFITYYAVLAVGLIVYFAMRVKTKVEIKQETGVSAPLLKPDLVESGRELIREEDEIEKREAPYTPPLPRRQSLKRNSAKIEKLKRALSLRKQSGRRLPAVKRLLGKKKRPVSNRHINNNRYPGDSKRSKKRKRGR